MLPEYTNALDRGSYARAAVFNVHFEYASYHSVRQLLNSFYTV